MLVFRKGQVNEALMSDQLGYHDLIMNWGNSLLTYMTRILPSRPLDVFRLYIAYTGSIILRVLAPKSFKSVGHMIPGKSRLMVHGFGVFAFIMPKTNDLGLFAGIQEPNTIHWFNPTNGDVVIDVGAHIGRYTLIAAKQAGMVVSVEPEPRNFFLLQENVKLNRFRNVIAIKTAVSDKQVSQELSVSGGGDTGTSSLEENWSWRLDKGVERNRIELETETLDQITDRLQVAEIDWLKIDVEGHEIPVLNGASRTLAKTRRLILEVAEGNETACSRLVGENRFHVLSIDRGVKTAGLRASSNWLLEKADTKFSTSNNDG